MNEDKRTELAAFAWHLGKARAIALQAIKDPELMVVMASFGVRRADLEQVAESAQEINHCFFNKPKPE